MSHKRFLTAGLAILIVIGLLIMGGMSIYRSGWSQGYMMGRLSAGDDGAMAPYMLGYPGHRSSFTPLLLCGAGLFVLLFIVAAKVFRFRTGKMADGPQFRRWAKHWHEHHGPMPPWCWEKPPEKETESDAEPGDSESQS